MKRLYGTTDLTDAELIRAHLRDAGIESTLDNQHGAFSAIGLPTAASPIGIYVRDEDAAEAAEILALHFEKKQEEEGEADPGAPAPLSAEESASFEERVRRGKPRRRFWLVFVWMFPGLLGMICYALAEMWPMAVAALIANLLFIGLIWLINALAGLGRKTKEPAP